MDDQVLVPTYLSICNADQRYYQGTRDKKILNQKLPMALIHEGIGKVVYDPTGTFRIGEQVIMIPNIPAREEDPVGGGELSVPPVISVPVGKTVLCGSLCLPGRIGF